MGGVSVRTTCPLIESSTRSTPAGAATDDTICTVSPTLTVVPEAGSVIVTIGASARSTGPQARLTRTRKTTAKTIARVLLCVDMTDLLLLDVLQNRTTLRKGASDGPCGNHCNDIIRQEQDLQ